MSFFAITYYLAKNELRLLPGATSTSRGFLAPFNEESYSYNS